MARLADSVPLAIVPLFGESLASFWLEHVAALGARHVIVIAADRPELVHAAIGEGRRWGVQVEFVAAANEPTIAEAALGHRHGDEAGWLPAPHDIVAMNCLPGCPEQPLFESYAGWFAALQAWIPHALTPSRVRVSELRPGVWVGSGARLAPSAVLHAPCWIGDHVTIESDAVIGPGAILGDRVVVGSGACISQSVIGPDTFVGRLTAVVQSLAAGSLLINWRTGSVLRVPDAFLLCSLLDMPSLVPATGIMRAAVTLGRATTKRLRRFAARFSRRNRAGGA